MQHLNYTLRSTLLCSIFFLSIAVLRSETSEKELFFDWSITQTHLLNTSTIEHLIFSESGVKESNKKLTPYHTVRFLLQSNLIKNINIQIENPEYQEITNEEEKLIDLELIGKTISFEHRIVQHRKRSYLEIDFIPLVETRKLISGRLKITYDYKSIIKAGGERVFANSSVLSSGIWYKISVNETGVYKITAQQLQSWGIDYSLINPKNIRIYGNGPKTLPRDNSHFRYDDLHENSIYIEGSQDQVFNTEDYILFYGQGPGYWNYDTLENDFNHAVNLYSDTSFYFLNFDVGAGKRIENQSVPSNFVQTISNFTDMQFHEVDQYNLLRSGRLWFGEVFDIKTDYDFSFNFPNLADPNIEVKVSAAGRTIGASSSFDLNYQGQQASISISSVPSDYTAQFARIGTIETSLISSSDVINLSILFNKGNSGALGWLDYIEVKGKRDLKISNSQLIFQNIDYIGGGDAKYVVETDIQNENRVWDITSAQNISSMPSQIVGSSIEFLSYADTLQRFIAFDGSGFKAPLAVRKIKNQNIHALSNSELVIVTPREFESEANEIAEIHASEDGLSVQVVNIDQVYNEFSGGKPDITAIKDFMKMMYDRSSTSGVVVPRYLLLLGDGSYDNKKIISAKGNFIPTYQTFNSLLPASFTSGSSYVSDDYYGLLDDEESETINDIVDIGIGRLPVKNQNEAANMVQKIRNYYDNLKSMDSWRNIVAFVGDDEDGNIHMSDANSLSKVIGNASKEFNIERIFLDAYQQQQSAGGARYPGVNNAINNRMDKGALVMSYTGHGGELGWAHERILEIPQINRWENSENMPLMITATCEFSRYDDPLRTSAGELTLLNPTGGNIALLTTTRLVYSSPNFDIAKAFFENLTVPLGNGEMPRLGDLCRITKFKGPKKDNTRNFTLLGDPAIRLAYPKYNIITTSIPDTIHALSKVTISGFIADELDVKVSNFNGTVYPIVYDKPSIVKTLNNDGHGVYTYETQKNIIFKGKASVKDGAFTFSFIVPKDISYEYGYGKISYYATDFQVDANGYFDTIVIGGFDSTAANDIAGPEVQLFMNDENFVFNGITDENPDIYAIIYDENGINTVGNGIGHDLTAILDKSGADIIVLNDIYESDLDSYQRGTVRYPLKDLEEGKHTLSLKVWDVYNNSSEAYTEFIVAKSEEFAIEHVLNYPNPFTTKTSFYFEHNFPGQDLDVSIQIFTVSGKLIKSMNLDVNSDGFRAGPFDWNGLDEFGDKIGKGVYIYKVFVSAPNGQKIEKYERLVILG